jgi:hypothetical protein
MQYGRVAQKVLFGKAVLAVLMSWRKCDAALQNGDRSRESNVGTSVFFETKSVIKMQRRYRTPYGINPPSENAVRRLLKQFQETDNVLHQKGEGTPSTSRTLGGKLNTACVPRKARMLKLFSILQY